MLRQAITFTFYAALRLAGMQTLERIELFLCCQSAKPLGGYVRCAYAAASPVGLDYALRKQITDPYAVLSEALQRYI